MADEGGAVLQACLRERRLERMCAGKDWDDVIWAQLVDAIRARRDAVDRYEKAVNAAFVDEVEQGGLDL